MLSIFIKTGTDTTESETIGVISKWGLPIHFQNTAAGWTWPHYDVLRFWLNSLVWFTAVLAPIMIAVALRKSRNKR